MADRGVRGDSDLTGQLQKLFRVVRRCRELAASDRSHPQTVDGLELRLGVS